MPRVPVRNGSYVVPRVRRRPHGTERKLLGLTALSEFRVPSPVLDAEEVEPLPSSRKRPACDSSSAVSSTPLNVPVCSRDGEVAPQKRVTFAEVESESASIPDDACCRRQSRPRRSCLRSSVKEGNVFPVDEKNNSDDVWYSSRLAHKPNLSRLSLSLSSRRVRIDGSVEDCPVSNITVDTATDVSVVSLPWLQSHPTLRNAPLKPVPPAAVSLRAANGSPVEVKGFIDFPIRLCGMTRTVTALVVPSLGPDSIMYC